MLLSESVQPFADATTRAPRRLAAHFAAGNKSLGYFCTYTPVELIHACGFIPVRITGGPGKVEKTYALAPDFICPFMKRAMEKAQNGDYRFLSGVVQGYSCDVACGMLNVWKENIGGELFHSFPLPYNDTPASRLYLQQEFKAFTNKAGRVGGRFNDSQLAASLDLYAAIRSHMLPLFDAMAAGQTPLTAADLHAVVQAGFVTPPENFLEMLATLKQTSQAPAPTPISGVPVMISGSLVESPEVLGAITALGLQVVIDDLCTGYRHFVPVDGVGDDPLERLIDRYMHRTPCPSRARAEDRVPLLLDRIKGAGARGVIFLVQKFCTPHLSDIPTLTKTLKSEGVPAIVVEMDETWRIDGQHQTRLEGFREMIENNHSR